MHRQTPLAEPNVTGLRPFGVGLITTARQPEIAPAAPRTERVAPFGIALITQNDEIHLNPTLSTAVVETTGVLTVRDGVGHTDSDARIVTD